jgi:D-alanyl-D-alanine carboxypeptidase
MFERFDAGARRAVQRAVDEEAPAAGTAAGEAEHLLLALAADQGGAVAGLLCENGLDHDGLVAALERETERSLAAVGVALGDFAAAGRPAARRRKVSLATSSKRSLERAVRLAAGRGERTLGAAHLLLGILHTQIGTVPRALAIADIDRVGLIGQAERLLD